jgi:hypothetical protein
MENWLARRTVAKRKETRIAACGTRSKSYQAFATEKARAASRRVLFSMIRALLHQNTSAPPIVACTTL